ncbi:MAG: protease, partial [Bacteroidota bacterium]
MKKLPLLFLIAILGITLHAQGTQLLRQPTVSSDAVVFVYANDLWKADRQGGDAIRLTTNEGSESAPHFSPDEKWIAFTAQYDGNTDVYVIPASGGSPKRLTYHPGPDVVQGWTPEGEVLFRSNRKAHPTRLNRWFSISRDGGLPTIIDIPRVARGELSPDGRYAAYETITYWDPGWRNYRGGQAQPIWILDMETKDLVRTPQLDDERHLDPVWYDGKVYYLSERDYLKNIWSFDPPTKEEKQITFFKTYDVMSLDATTDAIIFEKGGYLHLLEPNTGESSTISINVAGDMNFARPRWESITGSDLANPNVSPNGKRAIFEHRGEIFTFPKEEGSWRNITNTPGVADRYPIWSPEGDKIAWFSDASGEYQLVVASQTGADPKSYPLENPTFYYKPDWSPDGQHISYTDTDYNLWMITLSSGKVTKVATDSYAHPNRSMNPVWSPDSKWIAYAKQLQSHYKVVFAYQIDTKKTIQITDGMADAIAPIWDQSGEYLYFLASTDYGLNSGWLDMSSYDPALNRTLYCAILSKDTPAPTLLKSDEEEVEDESDDDSKDNEDGNGGEDGKESEDDEEELVITIDEEGLAQRIIPLDLTDGEYV